jgi:hypothetical protein
MAIRIKVNQAEFDQAASNGEVYGQYLARKPKLFVYAELGQERDYTPRDTDDSRADYKLFTNCFVEYYRSKEDLNSGDAVPDVAESKVTVIIYC